MIKQALEFKFHFILLALSFLVFAPLISLFTGFKPGNVILISFTLVVLAGFNIAEGKISKLLTILFGSLTLISVWNEFFSPSHFLFSQLRMGGTLALFCLLAFLLIRSILNASEIHIRVILGAMAAFLLIGLIGGVGFEIIEMLHPGSILLTPKSNGYDFYYYSFISLMTVGYGDIVPLNEEARALSILISLTGQFYMTIGIAMFVGKYLNKSNTK